MKSINREEFRTWEKEDRYWRGRWPYIETAIALVKASGAKSVLEIGPRKHALFPGQHTMDIEAPATYVQSATDPWEVDWHYDCVVALQVWEHLGPRSGELQQSAFDEIMHYADTAVLSFPFEWRGGDEQHRGVTREDIARWTLDIPPTAEVLSCHRLICFWRF